MKHEAGRQAPTVENPRNRTSGNEGQFFFGQKNPISRREFFKKAVIGSLVATPVGRTLLEITHRPSDVKAIELNPEEVVSLVAGFPDVPMTNPYYEAITGMAEAGIIGGYKDGTFGPNDSVKRAQFAKMIVGTMELPVGESQVALFTDLGADDPNSLYPHDYIAVAAEQGITKGTSATEFSPWKEITRAQVITMAVRAAENLKPGMLKDVPADYESTVPNFSDTHWQNLRKAEYNGLLIGLEAYYRNWDSWQNSTRGECAQILYNLMTFERQEKQGADLVSVEQVTKQSLAQEVQGAMDAKIPYSINRITKITTEHPVNAGKKVGFYLVETDSSAVNGKYFIQDKGMDRGYLVENYKTRFAISPGQYRVWLDFGYPLSDSIQQASFMAIRLEGEQFGKLGNETEEIYLERMLTVTRGLSELYGDGDCVDAGLIKDRIKAGAMGVYIANYHDGTYFYYLEEDQRTAMNRLIDSL